MDDNSLSREELQDSWDKIFIKTRLEKINGREELGTRLRFWRVEKPRDLNVHYDPGLDPNDTALILKPTDHLDIVNVTQAIRYRIFLCSLKLCKLNSIIRESDYSFINRG